MSVIIDYSTSRPTIDELRAAGITTVCRYIGWDSVPGFRSIGKNITKPEAAGLIAAGISVVLCFEYDPNAAANGTNQGHRDGSLALSQLAELGAPPSMTVYFAVDYDMPDFAPGLPDTPANALEKLGQVGAYFAAIRGLRNPYEIGVYGGYYACKRVLDAQLATKAWQTVAWSGGQLDSRAQLYQVVTGPPIAGADIDIREHASTQPDFGQWPRPRITGPVTPPPVKSPAPSTLKEKSMLILKVTAPSKSVAQEHAPSWTGTRTYLYAPGYVPEHIVSGEDNAAFSAVLPTVSVSWDQFVGLGGS